MNRLADILDREEPTMAVVITEPLDTSSLNDIASLADVLEFRADKFPSQESSYLAEQAGRLAILPLLLTIRYQAEGGEWKNTEAERASLFFDLSPQADGIDIELAAAILPEVVELAHSQGKTVVVSSHDFNKTPSIQKMEEELVQAQELGADYVKIAASAKTSEEFQRLAEFTLDHRGENLIVVAMDNYGPLSRIALSSMGSRLTYAFSGEVAVAPGQLGYLETHELLQRVYPNH